MARATIQASTLALGAMMKAVRYYGNRDVRLDTIPIQPCGKDEVRIKIAYTGICGSDLHEYIAGPIVAPMPGRPHPHNGSEAPQTLGHEFSGIVVELGNGSSSMANDNGDAIRIGQKVMASPLVLDKQLGLPPCAGCKEGKSNTCARLGFYGLCGPEGGMSEYLVIKATNVMPLPEAISLKVGALVEPLAVAWHCVRLSGFQRGQHAVVLGAGPIGLAVLLVLKVWGAKTIVVSEISEVRKEQARKFGADFVIDPREKEPQPAGHQVRGSSNNSDPVAAKVSELTGGEVGGGAHVAFEATGLQSTVDTAFACVRIGGVVMNVSAHEKPITFNPNVLLRGEKTFMGALCYTDDDICSVIKALENGTMEAEEMISAIVPLERAVKDAFEELAERRQNHVKILVQANDCGA